MIERAFANKKEQKAERNETRLAGFFLRFADTTSPAAVKVVDFAEMSRLDLSGQRPRTKS
jgi:hypothetical protein